MSLTLSETPKTEFVASRPKFNDTKLSKPLNGNQGSQMLEKYLNLEGFLEKSMTMKYAMQSTGNSLKCLEMSLNSIFCRT